MDTKKKRRVVITGLGTVNPTGNTVAESWANIKAGRCAVGPITAFDTADFKVKLAAEVKDFDPAARIDKREARKMARFTQFAVAAADEAVRDSGLALEEIDHTRFGVILSSGIGGLPTIEEEHTRGQQRGFEKVSPYFVPMSIGNMAAGQIAIRFGLQGMCSCPTTACAGGTNAIGDAFHRIRDGYEDRMLCGGSESCISPLGVGGFASMKALCTADDPARASIPFDARRSGFVMGEGSGVLLLEELEAAKARGAKIYAEVVGYGANCDAYHFTAPAPGGAGGAACMRLALADGGVVPEQIGYINAHGTSTHLNDSCETTAIKTVFGGHAYKLAVSSTKSMTGHLLGGAGGVEGVFTALALRDAFLPATVNLQEPDPELDLDYIPNHGRAAQVEYAMSDSLGFGGHNACVVFKRWEE
uniref:beta-ketoacyl-ACP synthase II n=1 Tax=Gemmiger formicilis TaxID=745368 RepID=UPI003FF12CF9